MKKLFALILIVGTICLADLKVGTDAPAFEGMDSNGKKHSLKDFLGKWVVLEWTNKDCPYVKKHYESGNMQKLQSTYTGKGVVWLSILSSAKGKQGFLTGAEANSELKKTGSHPTAYLLDPSGKIGKAYDAKTTPHMFVIDPKGKLVYAGAIDDNDSANPAVIASSKNYVVAALDSAMAGKPVATPSSPPYGCSVKY